MSLILVTDSTGIKLDALCAQLRDAGHEVISARSANAALGLVVSDHPQIIAVGKKLVNKSGCSFPRFLKAFAPESRVIVFDESADGADILEAITL